MSRKAPHLHQGITVFEIHVCHFVRFHVLESFSGKICWEICENRNFNWCPSTCQHVPDSPQSSKSFCTIRWTDTCLSSSFWYCYMIDLRAYKTYFKSFFKVFERRKRWSWYHSSCMISDPCFQKAVFSTTKNTSSATKKRTEGQVVAPNSTMSKFGKR